MKYVLPVFFLSVGLVFLFSNSALAEEGTDYIRLQRQCQSSNDPGCCMGSLRTMRDSKFQQAAGGKCPEGFSVEMNRCKGSLQWCEPAQEGDIAVNGGSTKFEKRIATPKPQQKSRRSTTSDFFLEE